MAALRTTHYALYFSIFVSSWFHKCIATQRKMKHFLAKMNSRLSDPSRGFGPACAGEPTVFGARRPGFPLPRVARSEVVRWMDFVQGQGIARVVCLLPVRQLRPYEHLLETYAERFGNTHVAWAPVDDFTLVDLATLTGTVLPFLAEAERQGQRAVVHCSAGSARTGHVLAAWLVAARGMANDQAIAAVRAAGRNPQEARDPRLGALLDACRAIVL